MKDILESKIVIGFVIFVLGFTYCMSLKEANEIKNGVHNEANQQLLK